MSAKFVNEYVEEMCDICFKFKYGLFSVINNQQVCKECCQELNKQIKIYEMERGL